MSIEHEEEEEGPGPHMTPQQRLNAAGWKPNRHNWKSPYTGDTFSEERALLIEDWMTDKKGPGE